MDILTYRQTIRWAGGQTMGQSDRQDTDRFMHRQTNRWIDQWTGGPTDG